MNEDVRIAYNKKVRSTYKKIKVKGGNCRYNFRCQMNAVHEAVKKKEKEIIMAIVIESDQTYIHFLNKNSKGIYTDNTLGVWAEHNKEYYLAKTITEDEFYDINKIFRDARDTFRKSLRWYERLFSDFNL